MDPKQIRAAMLALFTTAVSAGPTETLDNGHKVYSIRAKGGAIPFQFGLAVKTMRRQGDQDQDPEARDTINAPKIGRQIADGNELLEGVASSTSQDWYGTEMSLSALEGMGTQFTEGVSLFPTHGGFFVDVEWSEEIGRTLMGVVQRSDVAEPADPEEPGFILTIQAELYTVLEGKAGVLARDLKDRLDNLDQPIGLSIGGWFLDMRFITDDDGEIVRIIVESVLLDHVAVVRSPANPDSEGLKILRSIIRQALLDGGQVRAKPGEVDDPEAYAAALAAGTITEIDPDTPEARATDPAVALGVHDDEDDDDEDEEDRGLHDDDDEDDDDEDEEDRGLHDDEDEDEDEELSAPEAEEALSNGDNPSEVTSSPSLDTDPSTRDSHIVTGDERADNGGTSMDPELKAMLDAISGGITALTAGQVALSDRVAAVETRGAPDPIPDPAPVTTTDTDSSAAIRKLQETVDALQATESNRTSAMDALTGASKLPYTRRGNRIDTATGGVVLPTDRKSREALITKMLTRCKDEDDSEELCEVVKRSVKSVNGVDKSIFGLRWKARGDKAGGEGAAFREACEEGPQTLREICNASHKDGSLLHWIRTVGPQL